MTEISLSILFFILLLHYIKFLSIIYAGLNKLHSTTSFAIHEEFVSIIVPFRNETENILKCFESLIKQDYPEDKYEIIFVNDFSTDDSYFKIKSINKRQNVKVISVPQDFSVQAHKKRAIRYGIENSIGEIVVTTDADCTHHPEWLKTLLSFMDPKTGFISGPVEFEDNGLLFNRIQKLEFAGLVTAGAGLIGFGKPTICNAANIAYRKKVYNEVGGFTYQMNLSSGDDELLMQKIHKDSDYAVKFASHRKAIVKTAPNKNLEDFYQQRKRWASKGLFYSDKNLVFKLILIYLFYVSIPAQLLLGILYSKLFLLTFIISIISKLTIEFLILQNGSKLLFNSKILRVFPLAELFQTPYIIIAGITGVFGNYTWKNRTVNR